MSIFSNIPWSKPVLRQVYTMIKGFPPITSDAITKEYIRKLVGKADPVIFEIGCNDGQHTEWFLEVFENPTIYCFEPDPRAIRRFRNRIGDNPKVILTEIALSDENGEITFYQSDIAAKEGEQKKEYDASGSIKAPLHHLEKHPHISFDNKITVETKTIDAFCNEKGIDKIDFIWMDVQGAELNVFRGGPEAIYKNTHFLYTEYALSEMFKGQAQLGEMLQHLKGFKVLERFPGDVLLQNKSFKAS